jgi:hypothetical protein
MLGHAALGQAPIAAPGGMSFAVTSGGLNAVVTEGITVPDTPVYNNRYNNIMAEASMLTDSDTMYRGLFADATDSMQASSTIDILRGALIVVTDIMSFVDQPTYRAFTAYILADRIRVTGQTTVLQGYNVLAADLVTMSDAATVLHGLLILERLQVLETIIPGAHFGIYLTEIANLTDTLLRAMPAALLEQVGVSSMLAAQQAIQMLEAIKISSDLRAATSYNITVSQIVQLRDSLANFYGAALSDSLGFHDTLTSIALAHAGMSEGMVVGAALVPQLLVNITADDVINITPSQAVQMLFQPTVPEGVEISAAYVAPDGGFATWVMNTRTGGMTEYSNYAFNSFMQVGRKYVGASDTGLYELSGDTDDGSAIIARLRSGFMQFGGTQLSRVKEAYIAARNDGDWVLQLRTGDGTVWNYSVHNRSMRSTKIHMGKGQRARYFAFELISAGQDFDLDTLEFVPIVMQRRV